MQKLHTALGLNCNGLFFEEYFRLPHAFQWDLEVNHNFRT